MDIDEFEVVCLETESTVLRKINLTLDDDQKLLNKYQDYSYSIKLPEGGTIIPGDQTTLTDDGFLLSTPMPNMQYESGIIVVSFWEVRDGYDCITKNFGGRTRITEDKLIDECAEYYIGQETVFYNALDNTCDKEFNPNVLPEACSI